MTPENDRRLLDEALAVLQRVLAGDGTARLAGSDPLASGLNAVLEALQAGKNRLFRHLYHDELTDLPNRQKLMNDIQQYRQPVLILANIDHFKEINDFYGNLYGDYLLLELANRLDTKIKTRLSFPEALLYKMPGDEYAILFEKKRYSRKAVLEAARTIQYETGENPISILDNDVYVKLTVGIAMPEKYGEEKIWLDVVRDADIALKTARKQGQNVLVFDASIGVREEYENNLRWAKKIKEAIRDDRIVPYFQPIYNNASGRIEKYECLARMLTPEGEVVNPSVFLDIARRSKLYSEITRIMVEKCFENFRDSPYEFSINLSASDILHAPTNRYILGKLREYPEAASRLVFEILESEGIENYRQVHGFIVEVKKFGCKIAIDDFGTGYSNFEHILRLDVDYIKIDASLTKNLESDTNSQIITKTIADFSRQLGVKTISEFVHCRGVYSMESGLGVDYSQGYYFGEPAERVSQGGWKGQDPKA